MPYMSTLKRKPFPLSFSIIIIIIIIIIIMKGIIIIIVVEMINIL